MCVYMRVPVCVRTSVYGSDAIEPGLVTQGKVLLTHVATATSQSSRKPKSILAISLCLRVSPLLF